MKTKNTLVLSAILTTLLTPLYASDLTIHDDPHGVPSVPANVPVVTAPADVIPSVSPIPVAVPSPEELAQNPGFPNITVAKPAPSSKVLNLNPDVPNTKVVTPANAPSANQPLPVAESVPAIPKAAPYEFEDEQIDAMVVYFQRNPEALKRHIVNQCKINSNRAYQFLQFIQPAGQEKVDHFQQAAQVLKTEGDTIIQALNRDSDGILEKRFKKNNLNLAEFGNLLTTLKTAYDNGTLAKVEEKSHGVAHKMVDLLTPPTVATKIHGVFHKQSSSALDAANQLNNLNKHLTNIFEQGATINKLETAIEKTIEGAASHLEEGQAKAVASKLFTLIEGAYNAEVKPASANDSATQSANKSSAGTPDNKSEKSHKKESKGSKKSSHKDKKLQDKKA